MKRIYTLAVAALAMLSMGFGASAQSVVAPSMIQKAQIMYDLNTLYPKDASNACFNGFGVGYNIDFRVSNSLPLYVGTGLDMRFVFRSQTILDDQEYNFINEKVNSTLINLNLPVNLSYRVPVADNFFLTPFVGLDFRVQVYGNASVKANDISLELPTYGSTVGEVKHDYNLFSGRDLGSEHLRRFQMGWHAGLNFEYARFNLGLSYGTDFVKLHKNLGGSNFLVSVGYRF